MTETAAPLPAGREPHICDVLIAERAPRLTRSIFWPLLRPAFYKLLNYRAAVRMADAVRPLTGAEALDYMSDVMDLKIAVMNPERLGDEPARWLGPDILTVVLAERGAGRLATVSGAGTWDAKLKDLHV